MNYSKWPDPLAFKIGGVVTRVLVDEGDTVRRGQQLAVLDLREINAAVDRLFEGGATEVVVFDGHGAGGIDPELLDERLQGADEPGPRALEPAAREDDDAPVPDGGQEPPAAPRGEGRPVIDAEHADGQYRARLARRLAVIGIGEAPVARRVLVACVHRLMPVDGLLHRVRAPIRNRQACPAVSTPM